ncbi:hypothetical protein MRX96_004843 [Rhipicephalus microplus]
MPTSPPCKEQELQPVADCSLRERAPHSTPGRRGVRGFSWQLSCAEGSAHQPALERRKGAPACCRLQPVRKGTPFDAWPKRSMRVLVAIELTLCQTCDGRDAAHQVLGDRASAMQPASDIPCSRPLEVEDYREGGSRLSYPRRDLGRASRPKAPSGTADGLRPATPGHGWACPRILLTTSTHQNRLPAVASQL